MIDELCKLVQDNSYGKCNFCLLPTESLVLSVLQILLDAAQTANEPKENNGAPPSLVPNTSVNGNHKPAASFCIFGPFFEPAVIHCSLIC